MIANIFGPDIGIVLMIILVVVLFGSQLPKIARNAGMAGREFRKAHQEAEEDAERDQASQASQAATAAAVTAPPPAVGPAAPSLLAASGQDASITLTSPELDGLLQAREEQVKRDWASRGC